MKYIVALALSALFVSVLHANGSSPVKCCHRTITVANTPMPKPRPPPKPEPDVDQLFQEFELYLKRRMLQDPQFRRERLRIWDEFMESKRK